MDLIGVAVGIGIGIDFLQLFQPWYRLRPPPRFFTSVVNSRTGIASIMKPDYS